MSGSAVGQLILKDLYFVRWMIVGSVVAGASAVAIMPLSRVAAYVGGVSLICVLIILNIFLVMTAIVGERKDKVLLFMLSLPVSTTQYTAAKVAANAIAFIVPWLVLTLATVAVIRASAIPDGILPFWIAVLCYLLFYYCVLVGVGLAKDSTGWHAAAITAGNVSVNFLIPFLLARPSVAEHAGAPTAVWTMDIVAIAAVEVAAGLAALAAGVYLRSRNPDFV
jgi:ABC-type transport system involved in multi-copper enzyme maturation permease subunit